MRSPNLWRRPLSGRSMPSLIRHRCPAARAACPSIARYFRRRRQFPWRSHAIWFLRRWRAGDLLAAEINLDALRRDLSPRSVPRWRRALRDFPAARDAKPKAPMRRLGVPMQARHHRHGPDLFCAERCSYRTSSQFMRRLRSKYGRISAATSCAHRTVTRRKVAIISAAGTLVAAQRMPLPRCATARRLNGERR